MYFLYGKIFVYIPKADCELFFDHLKVNTAFRFCTVPVIFILFQMNRMEGSAKR